MCFLVILRLCESGGKWREKGMTDTRRGFILSRYLIL